MLYRWLLGGSIFIALLGLLAVGFLSSPWLTWYLLPAGTVRVVVDDDFPHAAALHQRFSGVLAEQPNIFVGSAWDRLAYAYDHWSSAAALEALTTVSRRQAPLRPVIIGELPNTLDTSFFFAAVRQGSTIRFLAAPHLNQLADQPPLLVPSSLPADANAILSVPGSALAVLPPALQASWDALLHQKLHFTHTKPEIFRHLMTADRVVILMRGDDLALGIAPAEQGEAAPLHRWVQDEERYSRPHEQAFRLPDGTIGRELVPGLAGDVFREPDATGCRAPLEGKTTLWLCERAGMVLLATDQSLAQQLPVAAPVQWLVQLHEAALQAIEHLNINGITALGAGNKVSGEIRFTD